MASFVSPEGCRAPSNRPFRAFGISNREPSRGPAPPAPIALPRPATSFPDPPDSASARHALAPCADRDQVGCHASRSMRARIGRERGPVKELSASCRVKHRAYRISRPCPRRHSIPAGPHPLARCSPGPIAASSSPSARPPARPSTGAGACQRTTGPRSGWRGLSSQPASAGGKSGLASPWPGCYFSCRPSGSFGPGVSGPGAGQRGAAAPSPDAADSTTRPAGAGAVSGALSPDAERYGR